MNLVRISAVVAGICAVVYLSSPGQAQGLRSGVGVSLQRGGGNVSLQRGTSVSLQGGNPITGFRSGMANGPFRGGFGFGGPFGPFGFGGFGGFPFLGGVNGYYGGYGGYGALYDGASAYSPPYFAIHPPVYYSAPVPRTYGYSPFPYPGFMKTPELHEVGKSEAAVIVNPHATQPVKEEDDQKNNLKTASVQVIVNPFVGSTKLADASK